MCGNSLPGFDNYYKIAVLDHIRVPKYWLTRYTWANTKKHISGVIFFILVFSKQLNRMKDN